MSDIEKSISSIIENKLNCAKTQYEISQEVNVLLQTYAETFSIFPDIFTSWMEKSNIDERFKLLRFCSRSNELYDSIFKMDLLPENIDLLPDNIEIDINTLNEMIAEAMVNAYASSFSLLPFLEVELNSLVQNPDYSKFNIDALRIDALRILFFDCQVDKLNEELRWILSKSFDNLEEARASFKAIKNKNYNTPTKKTENSTPQLQRIIPKSHVMPNNTLMNKYLAAHDKKPINAGAFDVPVIEAKKNQKEITTFVILDYAPEKDTTSNFTEYERDISDAIMSIWEQAYKDGKPAAFTTDHVYRAMPGRGEKASPQQKGAITKVIEKFLHLYVTIDATEELQRRGVIGPGDKYEVKGYYLPAQEHTYTARGGQPVKAWLILNEPIMLNYAKQTGQILTVPAKNIAIGKVKNGIVSHEPLEMSPQRQAMTSYMLRRIAIMKHDLEQAKSEFRCYDRKRSKDNSLEEKSLSAFRKQSDIILFATLFEATGTTTSSREMTRKNREFCFNVLDYWKATNYIKDYIQQKKGRSITGIKIIL